MDAILRSCPQLRVEWEKRPFVLTALDGEPVVIRYIDNFGDETLAEEETN